MKDYFMGRKRLPNMLLLWMAVLVTVVVVFTDPRDVALAVLAAGFWVTWGVREGREMN